MPDLVERDFTADRPGVKFVGDITYIHTWQGFIYLATVIEAGAIFHSDRGSVYNSAHYRSLVTRLGMCSSMGKTGVCWDNALAESFLSALKNERVHRTVYATKSQAKRDVIAYIEGFYNSRHRHSALGYRRPNDIHYAYPKQVLAA